MKWTKNLGIAAAILSSWSLVAPPSLWAAPAAQEADNTSLVAETAVARDVALHEGGVLRGRVVDEQGVPRHGTPVALVRQNEVVAVLRTDAHGEFEARNLSAGVYQLATQQSGSVYRLWAPRTAPPAANEVALLVDSPMTVRGQENYGILGIFSNPWILGAIVAAAIAIPLALDDDDKS